MEGKWDKKQLVLIIGLENELENYEDLGFVSLEDRCREMVFC